MTRRAGHQIHTATANRLPLLARLDPADRDAAIRADRIRQRFARFYRRRALNRGGIAWRYP